MAGLLDLLGLGGGGVSGVTPPGQGGGLLGGLSNFGQWADNHSGQLTGLGAGLLSGDNWSSGLASGFQQGALGKQFDRRSAKDKKAENATAAWLATQKLTPEQMAYLNANPDAAAALYAQSTAPKAPIKLGEGDTLLDPTTYKPLAQGQPQQRAQAAPKTETFFNPETGQNEVRQWDGQQWHTVGLATKPAIQQKPLTEGQSNAQGFAERMQNANKAIEQFGASEGTSRMNQAADVLPFGLGTGMKSAGAQQYDQAKRSFVTAVLRKESGAAIGKDEYEVAEKQYFPQPGEGPEVIAQKAQERRVAIENMQRSGSNQPGSVSPGGVKSTAVTTPDGYTIEPAD